MLCAATLRDERGVAAWERIRATFDPDTLSPPAYALLPRLAANLERIAPEFPGLARLRGYRRHTWTANQVARRALAGVATELDRAGISTLAFSAAAGGVVPGAEPALRRVHVPSLLVPPADWSEARNALARAGHEIGPPDPPGPVPIAWSCTLRDGDGIAVIVARAPSAPLSRTFPSGSTTALWSESATVEIAGRCQPCVGPHAALVIECVDAVAGAPAGRLSALAEVHSIASSPDLAWDRVVEYVREQHGALLVRDALDLAGALLALEIPASAARDLDALHLGVRDRVASTIHELPTFTVPLLGGSLDTVARAFAATAPLPAREALEVGFDFVRARWDIDAWRAAPRQIARKARAAARGRTRDHG
ncbi:MAG: hypothetical protein AMXMBFR46_26190 [Acidimicrobiia bacterium]